MKTMIRHITILMAVATMALLGGGCAEVNEAQQTAQPKGESEAVGFDVYTQRTKTRAGTAGDLTTSGLQTGTHKNDGFGVFAYYTGENSYDENIVPNFMYNQQVKYKSSASVFDYSPIKYWPNEKGNDHISFFAYAPWVPVDATTGAATGDKTYGITGVSRNTFTGAPIVNYIATTDLSKGVDLCWGNQLNKQKPTDASKVNFNLSHSLAKLNVQVKSSIALDGNTKIYIRSISFSGFTMKGALNLNNTSSTTPLWLGYDGLGRLNKDAVTIYDGRRDGREGYVEDANEGLTGLNPDVVQSTQWDASSSPKGVTNSAKNLFDKSSTTTIPATSPIYVIPTGDPVDVTIEYDIETKDDNLKGYYLSDGKTYGTSLANRITKTVVTDTEPRVPITLEAGKSYTLTLNLGIQDITFNAKSVSEWKSPDYDPINSPLTFEAITNTTISFSLYYSDTKVKYSLDEGEEWIDYDSNTPINLSAGDKLSFMSSDANTRYSRDYSYYSNFKISGSCYVYGNILSLINYSTTFYWQTSFCRLFDKCSQMKNHEKKGLVLPATGLSQEVYYRMFYGCTGLTKAPELPATSLTLRCYMSMFEGCTGLTTAPTLPATVLYQSCYQEMFKGCSGLLVAPALPATTLCSNCYFGMFQDCTSLTTAPTLPATEMEYQCYTCMFSGCTSMTVPPELPATTLAQSCYSSMFSRSGLVSAPVLNVTTLAPYCYSSMFYGCTGLTTAPTLPATDLVDNCYSFMFEGCTNLTSAPELPATNLASCCYYGMFMRCTGLVTAPTLPATVLDGSWYDCYMQMFYECSSLNNIKCLATSVPASTSYDGCTYEWVKGVAANGTFYINSSLNKDDPTPWTRGISSIPYNWTVENATP